MPFEQGVHFPANAARQARGHPGFADCGYKFGSDACIVRTQRSRRPRRIALQLIPAPFPESCPREQKQTYFCVFFKRSRHLPKYMLRSLIQLELSPFCPSYPVRTQTFSFTNRNRSAPRMLQTPPNGLCNTFRLQPQIPRPNGMNRATLKRESTVARAIRAHAKLRKAAKTPPRLHGLTLSRKKSLPALPAFALFGGNFRAISSVG